MKIGFVSDIHEDIHSLENAFRILSGHNCESVICLGDIVGFTIPFYRYIDTRNADECIRLIRENCSAAVTGNHDLYAIRKTPFYNAGFDYGDDWYMLDYEIRAKKSKNRIWIYEDNELTCRLSDSSKEYLSGLNEIEMMEFGTTKYFFSHFCFPDFSGSSIHFPSEAFHLKKHFEFMYEHGCGTGFSGHGHPEGIILTNHDKIASLKFGSYKIGEETSWIVAPCVARTTRENGVLILDTESLLMEAISLRSISF